MIGALAGLALGIVAAWLASAFPRWGSLFPLAPDTRVRNVAVVLLCGASGLALGRAGVYDVAFAVDLAICSALVCASAVDIEHMVLPQPVTLGGALLALATSPFRPVGLRTALVGTVAALVLTYVPHWIYRLIRKKSGQGIGDVHLALLVGAWLGPTAVVFVLLFAALQSIACVIVMRVFGLVYRVPPSVVAEVEALRTRAAAGDEEARAQLAGDPMANEPSGSVLATRLPFGPFLALGAVETRFAGHFLNALLDP